MTKTENLVNFVDELNVLLRKYDYRLETNNTLLLYSTKTGYSGVLEDRYNCISILEDEYSDIEIYTSRTENKNKC